MTDDIEVEAKTGERAAYRQRLVDEDFLLVESSNLLAVKYEEKAVVDTGLGDAEEVQGVLQVQFHSGQRWRYTGVSPETFRLLMDPLPGDSAGKFFDREIRRGYNASPVRMDEPEAPAPAAAPVRPTIVCLCGSTRFMEAFERSNFEETMAGKIVLTVGCNTKSDAMLLAAGELTEADKVKLDELHKRKIDLADEVLILNVGGYVGESTRSEIEYAQQLGRPVRWLETPA